MKKWIGAAAAAAVVGVGAFSVFQAQEAKRDSEVVETIPAIEIEYTFDIKNFSGEDFSEVYIFGQASQEDGVNLLAADLLNNTRVEVYPRVPDAESENGFRLVLKDVNGGDYRFESCQLSNLDVITLYLENGEITYGINMEDPAPDLSIYETVEFDFDNGYTVDVESINASE